MTLPFEILRDQQRYIKAPKLMMSSLHRDCSAVAHPPCQLSVLMFKGFEEPHEWSNLTQNPDER